MKTLVVAIVFAIISTPILCDENKEIKFNYEVGNEYFYQYLVNISTISWEYFGNATNMTYKVDFFLKFASESEGTMKITRVEFSDGEEDFQDKSEGLTNECVKFSLKKGQITELHPYVGEESWALNFKRGLLSVFQNSIFNLEETKEAMHIAEEDVHGICKTEYRLKVSSESVDISKTKNLTRCEKQVKEKYVLFSTPIHLPKEYITENFEEDLHDYNLVFPFSGGVQRCRFIIENGIYRNITCFEKFPLVLGARTEVNQTIKFIKIEKEDLTKEKKVVERKSASLVYEYSDILRPLNSLAQFEKAKKYVGRLCEAYASNLLIDTPIIFSKLVQAAKALNVTQLTQLYEDEKDICPSARGYFYDLLPYIGSEDSVLAMLRILRKEEFSAEILEEWLTTIAVHEPITLGVLEEAKQFLKGKSNQNPDILLTVSSIANTFCKNQEGCEENIREIVTYFENEILEGHETMENDIHSEDVATKLILNLKALANIGLPRYSIHATLSRLVQDESANPLVRITAIEVYRKRYCGDYFPSLDQIYKNPKENAEVRIASYLKVMECSGLGVLPDLYKLLLEEEADQVTYFIWSHINSSVVREIVDKPISIPGIQLLVAEDESTEETSKNVTKEVPLLTEFIRSKYKYPDMTEDTFKALLNVVKNTPFETAAEAFVNCDRLKNKYTEDPKKHSHFYRGEPSQYMNYSSYVIYSPSSFIPKTSMINITYNPFNKPIELLQVYTNAEGLDDYFLSLLGNQDLSKKIGLLKLSKGRKEANVNPKLSLGLKLFGNDLKFTVFNGEKSIDELIKEYNPIEAIKEVVSKGANFQKASIIADYVFSVPTAAGFPLNLKIIGTMYHMANVTSNQNNSQTDDFVYHGNLRPGYAASLAACYGVDGFYSSSGARGRLSFKISADLNSDVLIKGTDYTNVNLTFPEETMDLAKIRVELQTLNGKKTRTSKFFEDEDQKGPRCYALENRAPVDFCYGEDTFKNFFQRLGDGFVEMNFYLKRSNTTTKETPLLSYERKKISDHTYNVLGYSPIHEFFNKNVTINTKDGNLKAIIENEDTEKLFFECNYNNSDNEKYLMWDLALYGQPFSYWESAMRQKFSWENTKMNVMFAFYGFQGFSRNMMFRM